jgi:hypothetical protein
MSPQRRQALRKRRRNVAIAVAGALAGVLALAAVTSWLSRGREPAAVTVPASPSPVPAVDLKAAAAELAVAAPELTPASAEMVAGAAPGASGPVLAEMGLLYATRGFDLLDRAELLEMGQLFDEVYATLPPPDRDWMGQYMRHLREGSLEPEASVRGRRLLTQGVSLLAPERRARLQALVEKSIRAALEARRKAQGRTPAPEPAAAAPFQPFAPMPPNSPPADPAGIVPSTPSPGGLPVKDEDYWRSRMKEARARVARLRQRVKALDKDVRQTAGSTSLAQRSRVEELARLRAELAAEERAIGEIEEEARKAGALPGWLRE